MSSCLTLYYLHHSHESVCISNSGWTQLVAKWSKMIAFGLYMLLEGVGVVLV